MSIASTYKVSSFGNTISFNTMYSNPLDVTIVLFDINVSSDPVTFIAPVAFSPSFL